MKRAPLFVIAGTVAGLAGVLSFHSRPAAPAVLSGPPGQVTGGAHTARHARARGRIRGRAAARGQSSHSALGTTVQYGYGELAVRVTARGGRITNVVVAGIRTAEPYSAGLARQVIPTLRSEVLAGQTASINGVSGATYTSQAYARSLQAALDKLHLR
jgi:uncharacterized protein with FMN-binding domain